MRITYIIRQILILIVFTMVSCDSNKSEKTIKHESQNQILTKTSSLVNDSIKSKYSNNANKKIDMSRAYSTFVQQGYEINTRSNKDELINADLNKDGIDDFAALIYKQLDSKESNFDLRLAIYHGKDDGSYFLKSISKNLILKDHMSLTTVRDNVINLRIGSNRHMADAKFRYEVSFDDYMLIGTEGDNFGPASGDGSGITSTNFLVGKRIERINKYDETIDSLIALPAKTIEFDEELKPLGIFYMENLYEAIW